MFRLRSEPHRRTVGNCWSAFMMAGDAWRNGDVEVFRFTAEVFEEPHFHEVAPVAIGSFVVQTN